MPFVGLALAVSALLFLLWDVAAPVGTWNIFIPIPFEATGTADRLDPALAPANLLAEYRATVVAAINIPGNPSSPVWNVMIASEPHPGLLLTLTAPCTSAVADAARRMPARAVNEIDRRRGDLFSRLGLQLASEAERMEERLASAADGAGGFPDGDQLRNLERRAGALERERQELLSQILLIEKRLSPGKRPAVSRSSRKKARGVKTTTEPGGKWAGGARMALSSRTSLRARLRKTPARRRPPAASAKLSRNRLQQELTRLRSALETADRNLLELAQERQGLALRHERKSGADAELTRIDDENRRLAVLFEAGYAKPDPARAVTSAPPLHLRVWSAARPVALLLGFPVAWLILGRRRTGTPGRAYADTGISLLGTLPALLPETLEEMLHPACFAAAAPREALAIRNICLYIKQNTEEAGRKTLAIVGTHPGCGTSAAAALLTAALTNELHHILLLDLHWARPAQHRLWWIPWNPGAVSWLASTTVPASIRTGNQGEAPRAVVIPAGPRPPDPETALASAPWPKWLSGFPGRPAELLIADTGNLDEAPETLPQRLQAFDAVVLVTCPDSEDRVKRALNLLEPTQKPLLGILLTEIREQTA